MKLITAILFVAVVCYVGIYIFNAVSDTFETTPAVSYSIERTYPAAGYIIRTEEVLPGESAAAVPIVDEGEKVASGQAIVNEYISSEALEIAGEIRDLRLKIARLEVSEDEASMEEARLSSVLELSKALQSGDFSRLDELALAIESTVFSVSTDNDGDVESLRQRLRDLEAGLAGIETVYAPQSGYFLSATDGFEHISPDSVHGILPSKLTQMFGSPLSITGIGKLITEFEWVYAAIMNTEDAALLPVGRETVVSFTGAYTGRAEMMVEYVSTAENGERLVLFSSSESIHEFAAIRDIGADIVLETVSGIRIPKEAIHLEGESTYVFLQTGVVAERTEVEILLESGDSYIVRDGAETGSPLRVGSTIIVKANDLFDGKIVG